MKTRNLFFALALVLTPLIHAQSPYVTVTGSHLGGPRPANGIITWQPIWSDGSQASMRLGGGGITARQPSSATVTNGSFTLPNIPDTNLTNPQNVCFVVTVKSSSGVQAIGPGFTCVQPAANNYWCISGVCDFDRYNPNLAALAAVQSGPTGLTGPVGCAVGSTCSAVVMVAPLEGQAVNQPTGSTFAVNSINKTQVNADTFAGADLSAKVNAAQTFLNGSRGVISVNSDGAVTSGFTLLAGNDLVINANVSATAGTHITLAGSNRVTCSSGAVITVAAGYLFDSTANNLTIDHCRASGDATANAELLVTTGSSDIKIDSLNLSAIGAIHANQGSDLIVSGTTVTWTGAPAGYGVVWQGTNNVTVSNNHFNSVANGAQFFNADADFNKGGPTSRAMVMSMGAGHYTMTGNTCDHVVACLWGSVGYDVAMTGNSANVCGDVCFDTEGSIDVVISNNRASGATNGGVTSFFYTDNFLAEGNNLSSATGAPLIKTYNASGTPAMNTNFVAKGNVLNCTIAVCPAIQTQAMTDGFFEGNTLSNGTFFGINQASNLSIKRNEFNFTLASASALVAIHTPPIISGGLLEVAENRVSGVAQPTGSICIDNTSSDFNSTVGLHFTGNKCLGGFPVDLATTNSGTNAGTGVVTTVQGNWWAHNNVTHTHSTSNVDSYTESDKFILDGGKWTRVFPNLKALTGTRYICTDANGGFSASVTACSGT
jgi:hypothetical protein